MTEITYLQSHGMHFRANRRVVDACLVLDEAREIHRRSAVRRIQVGGWEWDRTLAYPSPRTPAR